MLALKIKINTFSKAPLYLKRVKTIYTFKFFEKVVLINKF